MSSGSGESEISKRIYVGNLTNNPDQCLSDLYTRFQKFGRIAPGTNDFEKHGTFAYINMLFDSDESFNKLRNSLNNVSFKGNTLRIAQARPNWEESWRLQHAQDLRESKRIEKLNMKREWEHYKKLENINKTWDDQRQVISGRMRKTPRKQANLNRTTFRVNVNGSLKFYKCYKTKLWGYERNKELKDLVYKYVNGKWWDGADHIIDRLVYIGVKQHSASSRGMKTTASTSNGIGLESSQALEDEKIEEEAARTMERDKVAGVLSQVLQDYTFDKPTNVLDSDEEEQLGIVRAKLPRSSKERMEPTSEKRKKAHEEEVKGGNSSDKDSSDTNPDADDDHDTEFIPSFTSKPASKTVIEGTISNTDTLRSLFNPSQSEDGSTFKLIQDSDADIDTKKAFSEEAVSNTEDTLQGDTSNPSGLLAKVGDQNYLFFPHFDSPFLLGQTQLTRIVTSNAAAAEARTAGNKRDPLENWEEEFRDNRVRWLREMKNKRRDALKQLRRKKSKETGKTFMV